MSDLSIPREAAEWAQSWLHDAAEPSFNGYVYKRSPEVMAERHERAMARIERVIAGLEASPAQRERCKESLTILHAIVRGERSK
jgi:hypothetical protein